MHNIHPTAIIDKTAKIGKNVEIGPYAVVEADTEIKDGCRVSNFATVAQYTHLGKGCTLFPHAVVGTVPQDLKFHGEKSFLEVGDNTTFREFCMINRGTENGGGTTKIGSNCLIMAFSHIAHDCIIGNNVILANGATLAGHITIEDYATIGGLTAIHQFVRIGRYAMVGGASGVPQDILPFCLSAEPRATLHGINKIGLTRHNFSRQQIDNITKAYKMLFMENIPVDEAINRIEMLFPNDSNISHLIKFIKTTKRGFCRPRKK
ncbi:MAG: acyl-ACP--UDP-N-acetylglucosamine O-acyltransferase [Epsilonproteobacteria bacterium]|nr:acyl-ACP--UDP-N-acetylglucosamine O-acyltransferase [Campylobacterota bacterium]